MNKRALSLLLALLLALSVFSFASAEDEEIVITIQAPSFGGLPNETIVGKAWEDYIRTATGKNIVFKYQYIPWGEIADKQKIAFAANDFPDLVSVSEYGAAVPYLDQGIFVELSPYQDLMPNYLAYAEKSNKGLNSIYDANGHFYGFHTASDPRLSRGLGIYNATLYRYDTFNANGIDIPETVDEFTDAASQLKALYPDKYPVAWNKGAARWFQTYDRMYWDGTQFTYGPASENWKMFMEYSANLYSMDVLDPDSLGRMSKDDLTTKALNGSLFMVMSEWFNYTSEWYINDQFDGLWVNSLFPENEDLGYSWWNVDNVNEYDLQLDSHFVVINASSKVDVELLVKICDLAYTEECTRLVTWGIEGLTYEKGEDGLIHFVDSIRNAENPWDEGNKYGMRASSSYRPGLQLCLDSRAFIDFAPVEPSYINGEVVYVSWEEAFPDYEWPTDKHIMPNIFAPALQWTVEESQNNSKLNTAITTYVDECTVKFITGELNLNEDWDNYIAKLNELGLEDWVNAYNEKAGI